MSDVADESDKSNSAESAPEKEVGSDPILLETERLKKEMDKWKTDYLYLRADFDNYRKRVIKEREDLMKYEGEKVLKALLEVQDNFERALQFQPTAENFSSFATGIKMIAEEIKGMMSRFGVSEVPSQGLPYDPNVNEALSSEVSQNIPAGHVTRVLRKAYKMHDRIIRAGQVLVAAETDSSESASETENSTDSN